MPTVENWTVDTDGTGDYSSLSSFESNEQQDLVTNDIQINALCEAGAGAADTTAVVFSGWTCDATRYIEVRGNEAHGGKWNASNYRLEVSGSTIIDMNSGGNANFIRFVNLQVGRSDNGRGISTDSASGDFRVERCLLRKTGGAGGAAIRIGINDTAKISNCIIFGDGGQWGSGVNFANSTSSKVQFAYNCTAHDCPGDGGFYSVGGTAHVVKNCIGEACAPGFGVGGGSWHTDSDYNAADDATAPGGNSQNGSTTFVDEANDDFHLSSGDTISLDNGTDLSGDADYPISVDNENATRTGTWDIGAHQLTVGGAARRVFVVS